MRRGWNQRPRRGAAGGYNLTPIWSQPTRGEPGEASQQQSAPRAAAFSELLASMLVLPIKASTVTSMRVECRISTILGGGQ